MSRLLSACLVVLLAAFTACSSPEQEETIPATGTPAREPSMAEKGAVLFQSKCAVCHGSDGTAGIGGAANLQQNKMDSVALYRIIHGGKGNMPAFKASLSDNETGQVIAYIKTLSHP